MRRRGQDSGPQPPERLRLFLADEWAVPPLKGNATVWEAERWHLLAPYFAWRDARRAWSEQHGDALGDFVERFRFEYQVRRAHYSAVWQVTR